MARSLIFEPGPIVRRRFDVICLGARI